MKHGSIAKTGATSPGLLGFSWKFSCERERERERGANSRKNSKTRVAKPTKYVYLTLDLTWNSPYMYIAPWFQTKFFKGLISIWKKSLLVVSGHKQNQIFTTDLFGLFGTCSLPLAHLGNCPHRSASHGVLSTLKCGCFKLYLIVFFYFVWSLDSCSKWK